MRGLQIWAHSFCRSTLAFYGALGDRLGVPFRICLARTGLGIRQQTGFDLEEFSNLELVELDGSVANALLVLEARKDWNQLFGTYQTLSHVQAALAHAIKCKCRVAIASEAPCNMFQPSAKRLLKTIYLSSVAKRRFSHVFAGADFIINWSGDDAASLQELGWRADKIIPLGYFPPPLKGSSFTRREGKSPSHFSILCTGNMTWHRGPDVLMNALALLKRWGIPAQATFTSEGPLQAPLKRMAEQHGIDCAFPGFVPMSKLIELYENCSVFVAPGRAEPWGMRVNDALHCGAPIIISRGMGAHKLVNDCAVGVSFAAGDAVDLAWQIRRLATDSDAYRRINDNLADSRKVLMPEAAAERVATVLPSFGPHWVPESAA